MSPCWAVRMAVRMHRSGRPLAVRKDQLSWHHSTLTPHASAAKGSFMNANDFRELALGFDDTEESSHMSAPDFRVGGRIFATLAHEHLGFGNLMLSPELQHSLIAEAPEVFLPVSGGWGRRGITHIRLAEATPQQLLKGLQLAWNLRVQKNDKSRTKGRSAMKPISKSIAEGGDWRGNGSSRRIRRGFLPGLTTGWSAPERRTRIR
jgi:hypothetical protein